MCEFLSAIKDKDKQGHDKYYFLTSELIHNTPKGEVIRKRFGGDDLLGHSAIRAYFELGEHGSNWEQTDFSTPKNFPGVIARAVKRGEFRGIAIPNGLLTQTAYAEYQRVTQPAYDEYERVRLAAFWDLFADTKNRAEAWR